MSQRVYLEEGDREGKVVAGEVPSLANLSFSLPISPRDRLSYVEDRKVSKEFDRYEGDNPGLSRLLALMQIAVMEDKPDNILDYLAEEFFSESGQQKLRKELKDVKEWRTFR